MRLLRLPILYLLLQYSVLYAQHKETQRFFMDLPIDSSNVLLEEFMTADSARFLRSMVFNGVLDTVNRKMMQVPYFYIRELHNPFLPKPDSYLIRLKQEQKTGQDIIDYLCFEEEHHYKLPRRKMKKRFEELRRLLSADYDRIAYQAKNGIAVAGPKKWAINYQSVLFYDKGDKRPRLILVWIDEGKHSQGIEVNYRKN